MRSVLRIVDGDDVRILIRYSEDQERDDHGRFGSGGGDGAAFDDRAASAASGIVGVEKVTPFSRATEDELMAGESIGGLETFAVRNAIADYGGEGHESVNGALRSSAGDVEALPDSVPGVLGYSQDRAASQIEGLDAAMSVSKLTSDVVVHRGVPDPEKVFGTSGDLTGMQFRDHGYVSTTTTGLAGGMWTGNQTGLQMRILVPEGTSAISSFGLDRTELLLDRGLSYTVVRDYDAGGIRTLDVEVGS